MNALPLSRGACLPHHERFFFDTATTENMAISYLFSQALPENELMPTSTHHHRIRRRFCGFHHQCCSRSNQQKHACK